jgi:very-short-patch-repair endonuclease
MDEQQDRWRLATARARRMRQQPTAAERVLWRHLRGRRLCGVKFRRQHPIGVFIVDFCCPQLKLVLELDGGIHSEPKQAAEDRSRQETLEAAGFVVLRLHNNAIAHDLDATLDRLHSMVAARLTMRPQ